MSDTQKQLIIGISGLVIMALVFLLFWLGR